MSAPRIDVSRHPIVTVTFDGLATEEEFERYLADMTQLILERRQKSVTILDARKSGRAPPSQRRKQAEWLKRQEHMLREYSLGTVFVITSPLVRGVLTAILWTQSLPTAHTVVGTLEEANRWANTRLESQGVAAPR